MVPTQAAPRWCLGVDAPGAAAALGGHRRGGTVPIWDVLRNNGLLLLRGVPNDDALNLLIEPLHAVAETRC